MIFVRDIQRFTAEHYGIEEAALSAPDGRGMRPPHFAHPRQMAMLLSRRMTGKQFSAIGRAFRRDHSTIIHGIRSARRRCLTDRRSLESMCAIRALVLANG